MNMSMSASECSSGCESGWTMYLDNSSDYSENRYPRNRGENVGVEEEDEDEDLSMVSDASSGPRHFQEDEQNGYYSVAIENTKKIIKKEIKEKCSKKQSNCFLDDTASSPVFNFSKRTAGLPNDQASTEHITQGFSTTKFKEKSAFQKQNGHGVSNNPDGGDTGKSGGLKKVRKWQ